MKLYQYGDYPTLEEIRKDYYELMEIIKNVNSVAQAKELEKQGFIIEINGDTINTFIQEGKTDEQIDWIRYESYGCLTYIYKYADGRVLFDVWCIKHYDEFIWDTKIEDITEDMYNRAVSDANLEQENCDTGEEKDNKPSGGTDMKQFIKINGTEVPVEIEVDMSHKEDQIIENFVDSLVVRAVDHFCDNTFDLEALTEDEIRNIQDVIFNECDYMYLLATGEFYDEVKAFYQRALRERAKYYTFSVEYKGEVTVSVKASTEEDAQNYIRNLSEDDLFEYCGYGEASISSIDCTDCSDDEPYWGETFDITT